MCVRTSMRNRRVRVLKKKSYEQIFWEINGKYLRKVGTRRRRNLKENRGEFNEIRWEVRVKVPYQFEMN